MCFLAIGLNIGPPRKQTKEHCINEGSLCAHPLPTFPVCSPTWTVPKGHGVVRGWEGWGTDATALPPPPPRAPWPLQPPCCASPGPVCPQSNSPPSPRSAVHFRSGQPLQCFPDFSVLGFAWSSRYYQATSNLIIYTVKFFSLFLWLLPGGKLWGGCHLPLSSERVGSVLKVAIPLGPGGSLGFRFTSRHLIQTLVMPLSPSVPLPKASCFANIWVTFQSPVWLSSSTTHKASSGIKFPLWEIMSGSHFLAQTLLPISLVYLF